MKRIVFLLFAVFCLGIGSGKAQYTVLFEFHDSLGNTPYGGLLHVQNRLYGTTAYGGIHGAGNIFTIDTNGFSYKDVYDFKNYPDGGAPSGSLIIAGDTLFGTASTGGYAGSGVVFSVDSNGSGMTNIWNSGDNPVCNMVLSNQVLYGIIPGGGAHGFGVVFSIHRDGSGLRSLLSFNITNGRYAFGSLTLSGKTLFAMTYQGGDTDLGTVFRIDTDGTHYMLLHNFTGPDGENPDNTPVVVGNRVFGAVNNGGAYNAGCIFSMDSNGFGYRDIFDFNGSDGGIPTDVIFANDKLYGMTTYGGVNNYGCIFSIDTDGTGFSVLHYFDSVNGSIPNSVLTRWGNTFYGMTTSGGIQDAGVVFKYQDSTNVTTSDKTLKLVTAISVFPNPTTGIFTISFAGTQHIESANIEIYNVLGEKVLTETLRCTYGASQIDLSAQPNGIYFYRVISENGELVGEGKIVKE